MHVCVHWSSIFIRQKTRLMRSKASKKLVCAWLVVGGAKTASWAGALVRHVVRVRDYDALPTLSVATTVLLDYASPRTKRTILCLTTIAGSRARALPVGSKRKENLQPRFGSTVCLCSLVCRGGVLLGPSLASAVGVARFSH